MDGATLGLLIMYLVFAGIGILVSALIMRAIFSIPTIVKLLTQIEINTRNKQQ
ncbi:hypothetical protein SAMN05216490_4853 [Mucilaginibacter mallensis]|uniref:Uncharacterized protein n=1 Tax=Mucilaginibacter mallensis TaxID=652787 RepID=A0A1H2CCD3_MUCMA|nr:hypothetical protein SAMN05216490_4853 [Mucilaginibacter mallensis]